MQKNAWFRSAFVVVVAGLVFSLVGNGQGLISDANQIVRLAASDAITANCSALGTVDYSNNGVDPLGSVEGRRAGLSCQRTDMLSGSGDPFVKDENGASVNATANAQVYADAAMAENAPSVSLERRYARAQAAVLALLDGFAIVPGGPSEAFNRIQTCLAGEIQTNQNNLVVGVALDCGEETVRRAVAELVAPGFYVQFGNLVGFDCTSMESQARSGPSLEARWAGALAYVMACSPNLQQLAESMGAENSVLSFAAVAPLASTGAIDDGGGNVPLANAYAQSLELANGVSLDAAGNPAVAELDDNLFAYATANAGSVDAFVAHAPLARHIFGPGEIRISIAQEVDGATIPLIGTVLLRD